ncbi:MAG: DUF2851 family protein [Bacteroidales bacterium]|nr:DUF2851 family protein [Bacteroidales bacterium]
MTEAFLQYVWRYQLLEGPLITTEGQPVHVSRAGELNTDAGPDFFYARIEIGGVEWSGNVEIHVKASDWRLHKHQQDHAYDNVVLHVVYDADEVVATAEGRKLPTLSLQSHIPSSLWDNYELLLHPPKNIAIPCVPTLVSLPSFKVTSYMERLVVERIERKTMEVRRLLKEAHGGWEQCCYWLMGHYFGGKTNAFPFELLVKATDMRLLARWKDNPQRLEALLMGQAGFLEAYFDDEYPRQLQSDYQALRAGSHLTPISSHLWKFFRLRPSGFPTLRISQFSQLVSRSTNLFSKLLETPDADRLMSFFDVTASPYWNTHYQFDKPSRPCVKSVGRSFAQSLIINAWIPMLFEYGATHGEQQMKDRALELLHQLPPEENKIVHLWKELGVSVPDAAASQALIQLYNEYCTSHRCLQCHIGYHVLKSKAQ